MMPLQSAPAAVVFAVLVLGSGSNAQAATSAE